jgi:putative iron-dependent peroxidase
VGSPVRRGAPAELHPFRELLGEKHRSRSTPGDLLFHIRAAARWICFELARHVIGTEDGCFGAGSYVIAQKYLHGLPVWNALSTEDQQRVIGARDSPQVGTVPCQVGL